MLDGPRLAVATPHLSPEDAQRARAGLDWYLTRWDVDARPYAAARYEFVIARPLSPYGWEKIYEWMVVPREGVEIESQFGRKAKRYAMPRDTIEEIPHDDDSAYRGMSWEEWQFIRRTGTIQSSGAHNLDQPDLTFFGDADQATSYAGNFAPLAYKPAFRRPGVVIQIARGLTLAHGDMPDLIPQGELAVEGALPASVIEAVWLLVPYQISYGRLDVIAEVYMDGTVFREGSRGDPTVWYEILPLD
ncbi:MAG: hypothetical protein JSV86_10530 [Gemmatimonadota bacterium]|nr:MAG: hypothetical protein JSV86_10530 [Gemmatimonadota bacterium]